MSLYVESYESEKVHDENTQAFAVDLIIPIHMNLIQRALFSWIILYIGIWKYFFPRTILVEHMIHFRYSSSLTFDIGAVIGLIFFFKK